MIRVYQQKTLDIFPLAQDVIKDSFSLMAQDQGHITLQKSSYNPLRQQYNAAVILDDIASKNDKDIEYKLCLVNVDIYAQNMNFIFGLANPIRKTAIVSTYRLNGDNTKERISKEIVHEIGHLFGLVHCANNKCIMHFSNTVKDTDEKEQTFCQDCRSKIE